MIRPYESITGIPAVSPSTAEVVAGPWPNYSNCRHLPERERWEIYGLAKAGRMDGMGVPRYVSPLYALIRDNNVTEGGIKNYCVTDDVALVVDRAVAKLAARDAQMGNFIWLYFGAKYPALRIARENDMGEAKARELIKAGVAWVDCAIEVFREAA